MVLFNIGFVFRKTRTRNKEIRTLKPTYVSISNSVNKTRHIAKHSTDSTNDASTVEHISTKQTVNELSHSAANENVPATPSPSVQPEDDGGGGGSLGFPVNTKKAG